MLVLLGYLVVIGSVVGGYLIVGGHLGVLYQPSEFLIIAGAGIGAFLASTNGKGISATIRVFPKLITGHRYSKRDAIDLLTMLYHAIAKLKKEPLKIEADLEDPESSDVFGPYASLLKDKLLRDFIIDYLKLMATSSNLSANAIHQLMSHEIETFEEEAEIPAQGLSAMADALPAFGIVAAVMGVVHALGSASLNPEGIGPLIAHAMVGTFLGILLAYGFVSPLAARVRTQIDDRVKMLQVIKVTLLASKQHDSPSLAVEFGRKALFSAERPAESDLNDTIKQSRKSG